MLLVGVILSYLLGSIPAGAIMGKVLGRDVRRSGSGNIGATNVMRVCGPWAALPVLAVDVIKGYLAVWIGRWTGGTATWAVLCALAAIAGHNWSIFLRFKGGKGVATTFGAFFGLAFPLGLTLLGVWFVSVLVTRYVSVGSMLAGGLSPLAALALRLPRIVLIFCCIEGALIIWQHRANLRRLLSGSEFKFGTRLR